MSEIALISARKPIRKQPPKGNKMLKAALDLAN
jgi:hypothetical protein